MTLFQGQLGHVHQKYEKLTYRRDSARRRSLAYSIQGHCDFGTNESPHATSY